MNFGSDAMLLFSFASFSALAAATLIGEKSRALCLERKLSDWFIDGSGLAIQGFLIPFLQVLLVFKGLEVLWPTGRGSISLNFWQAFLLNFVAVDYLYYWNHRLLHRRGFWPLHVVHHTARGMDVFMTSRNSLWSSFFVLYLWVNGGLAYLLSDPRGLIAGAALTAALDLWRHSGFGLPRASKLHRMLAKILITPHEHAVHHSGDGSGKNFGANFSLWDRLHGTYRLGHAKPRRIGLPPISDSAWVNLLWPWHRSH